METHIKRHKQRPKRIEDMTKEQLRQAVLKKRECNSKAQNIVESLLEKQVTEDYFIKCLSEINQSHFEDIIEERSVILLCGYPLCCKTLLVKDIPKQKYRISVKTNKVYDITARKKFCSNSCFKAAIHVKEQMLTSPLWFREHEEIPTFNLIPLNTTGALGQEVDVSLIEKIKIEKPSFASINEFAKASLSDISSENIENINIKSADIVENIKREEGSVSSSTKTAENTNKSIEIKTENNVLSNKVENKLKIKEKYETVAHSEEIRKKKEIKNPLNIVGDIVEKADKMIDPIIIAPSCISNKDTNNQTKKVTPKKPLQVTILTIEIEKCLAEWFTLDTILLILGEDKVKEMVADKGECIKEYLNNVSQSILYNSNTYDQYQVLCKKLNMLELEDRKFDSQITTRETKPLPDYKTLQEESKKMQLKVKAFFEGEIESPEANTTEENVNAIAEQCNETQLPLVDKHAQNALRRRIVYNHVNKVLPHLLRSLGLLTLSISSDIRQLINTFKLKANNIMFKPIQWTLIAIIMIKLLSIRDKRLEYLLQQQTAFQHMQLLLLSYQQDGGYLDRLVLWLTDIDRLLDTNNLQLTIG